MVIPHEPDAGPGRVVPGPDDPPMPVAATTIYLSASGLSMALTNPYGIRLETLAKVFEEGAASLVDGTYFRDPGHGPGCGCGGASS